ncbi:ABC transporter permease [Virgibacillus alimentarius]|uniref:ABC transporter permease n=1 Tax=Virgibacillus alimentarius TaxID=698769 RepID=UPI000493A945|nr:MULTISPECIES: ABC transporter permease [Virgibacillus]HLR67158.1 ABC transporter permease [Virgibacillus sp.]
MRDILKTRLIHIKKQWLSLLFWLLFPILTTLAIINLMNIIQSDTKVPVGIILEEKTNSSMELYQHIKETPFIRVYETTEDDALHRLKKHELDSVFIIHEGYEEKIRQGKRNQLITSYQSDLSFAFSPIKEMIISYAQQETSRSKAAHIIQHLSEQYPQKEQWSWKEIINKSKSIQKEENLLYTKFTFSNTDKQGPKRELFTLDTWGIWALLSILTTLFIFDWLIKEQNANILPRFVFIRFTWKKYLLYNFLLYTILFLMFDMVAIGIFHTFLKEPVNLSFIGAILSFRLMLNTGAFLLALCFKNIFLFYSVSFIITLFLSIASGAILPIESITRNYNWVEYFNPLHAFLSGQISYLWSVILIALLGLWCGRKEKYNA